MERVSFSSTRRAAAAVSLALALTACGSSAPTPVPTSAATAAPTATPTPVVTATPTTEATASPTAAPTPTFLIYWVKKTDVHGLSAIAARFKVTLHDLIAANPNLKPPYYIWAGMRLNIPPIGWHAPTPGPS
jgi:LysM repeat protein